MARETAESGDPPAEARKTDWFGLILGAGVFLAGIGLLAFTFAHAFTLFTTPRDELMGRQNPEVTRILSDFSFVVLRIGMLLVMSIVGSIISGKGVRMYLAARASASHDSTAGRA